MDEGGWCETCNRGIFGTVSTTHKEHFDEAVAAFRRLKLGLANLEPCEICGVAMYSNAGHETIQLLSIPSPQTSGLSQRTHMNEMRTE
jgi:hypothetical protein